MGRGKQENSEIRTRATLVGGEHSTTAPSLLPPIYDLLIYLWHRFFCWIFFLISFFFFLFHFTEHSCGDTMTRIRLSTLKCLVVCFGIAVLVLITRTNLLWRKSLSTKEWSTFYQELTLQLSHPQSTLIFCDLKSGFLFRIERKELARLFSRGKVVFQYRNKTCHHFKAQN